MGLCQDETVSGRKTQVHQVEVGAQCCSGCTCPAVRPEAQMWSTLCVQSQALRVPEVGGIGLQFLLPVFQ